MDVQEKFGEIRSLLQQPPSEQVWRGLCALVDASWGDDQFEELLFPYILEHLRRWPDALRVMPPGWWALSDHAKPSVLQKLARVVDLGRENDLGEAADASLYAWSMRGGQLLWVASWDGDSGSASRIAPDGVIRTSLMGRDKIVSQAVWAKGAPVLATVVRDTQGGPSALRVYVEAEARPLINEDTLSPASGTRNAHIQVALDDAGETLAWCHAATGQIVVQHVESSPAAVILEERSIGESELVDAIYDVEREPRTGPVAIALSGDGDRVFVGHVSGYVCGWEVASGEMIACWQINDETLHAIASDERGERVAIVGEDALHVWDVGDGEPYETECVEGDGWEEERPVVIAFGDDGQVCVASAELGTGSASWRTLEGEEREIWLGGEAASEEARYIGQISLSPAGDVVVLSDERGILSVVTARHMVKRVD